jgi:hypothetical protein
VQIVCRTGYVSQGQQYLGSSLICAVQGKQSKCDGITKEEKDENKSPRQVKVRNRWVAVKTRDKTNY